MNSQLSKAKDITEEEFRSCYPDVSIQHLTDKASAKVTITFEKRQAAKSPSKAAIMPKTTPAAKSPAKMQTIKTTQNVKTNIATPKLNIPTSGKTAITTKALVTAKTPTLTKTQIVTKTPVATKTPVELKTPVAAKTVVGAKIPSAAKTPVSNSPVVKTPPPPPAVKIANLGKTPTSLIKGSQTRQVTLKTAQNNIIKQQTPNVAKTKITPVPTSTPAKEEGPDQSTMTILNYHMPQAAAQRSNNQLTIEKIEQQQRIPVVLDTNNPLVLQQVISNGQLVLQNRVAPAETTVQSLVIGTTAQPLSQVVPSLPEVETTTSEPLHALQVTQQVTLFRPKGHTFTVDEVKKQININKQSAMTNVVSSTTNSIPAPVPVPTQSAQPEMKKVVFPARTQGVVQRQSPGRQSNRVNPQIRTHNQQKAVNARQYQSTRGQVKKVSLKREMPQQKVVPMQPPPLPPPELQFGNEEEVTTSEEVPQLKEMVPATKLIVILPSGEEKYCSFANEIPLNYTVQDLLQRMNVPITENMQKMTAELTTPSESFQDMDGNEEHWNNSEHIEPEPGEILGLHNDMEAGELDGDTSTQRIPVEETDEPHKDIESLNNRKTKAADSLTGESPKRKKICKKKKAEEPVCLTISDDEELLGLAHHHHHHSHHLREETFHSDSNHSSSQMSSCDKEPIITDEMVTEMKHSVSGGGLDLEEMLDNSNEDEKTYLQCRTVRIGSYKVVPKDKVVITPHGLKVTVPILNSDQFVELKILYHEIIKVLIHFGRQMPVLFFYTRPTAAAKIRKALNMVDRNGFYYDTTSSDETHRRITFLPDKIDDDCKQTLKNIFGDPENNVFAELTGKEANDILVKASPKEVQAFILKKQPNNNQQQQQQQPFNGQNIQTIMVYPPPPEKGGIPINTEDYACLGEDQFLNDVIIDFYLKYVVEKTLSAEDRTRTHVFSSFFYKRLTTKPPPKRKSMNPVENDPTATPAMKRHSRVKSWTKNVDLFTKDFIVIPINENSHWFLAIICFPGLTGPVRFADNMPIELPGRKKSKTGDKAAVGVLSGKHTVTIGSTTITAVTPTVNMSTTLDVGDEGEDRDEADGEDEDMDVPDIDEEIIQKPALAAEVKEEPDGEQQIVTRMKKQQREPIKQPCILIFDSLAGASRSRVVATLRDYLRVEYETKHGEPRDLSGDVMKGSNVRCPQQTNYTDCGLYVLQYVEAFFQWPVTDYHIPIKQLQDWFATDIVGRKRYEIQQLLLRLMEEQRIDIEALSLPILNLRPEGKLVEYSGTEEEDDDEDEDDEEQMCEDEEEDILEDDGEFNDEMEHDEEMEEGEIGHHDEEEEEDPDHFMDPSMDHEEHEMEDHELEEHELEDHEIEDHEMDEEEYLMDEEDEEDDELQEDIEDKELEDVSLTPICPVKKDLKGYRIPRLVRRSDMSENSYKED